MEVNGFSPFYDFDASVNHQAKASSKRVSEC